MSLNYVYMVSINIGTGASVGRRGDVALFADPRHILDSIKLSYSGVKGTSLEPILPKFISVLGPTIIKNKLGHTIIKVTPTPIINRVEHL